MFKRLAKSKRHSVEGVCGDPSPPVPSTSPPPSPTSLTASVELPNVRSARAPRAKQARRSCGDQPLQRVMQPLDNYDDEHETDHQMPRNTRVNAETDYQMVTAVPAYIVEHEPEKQKGLGVWGRRMSKKIDSFRRSSCRDALLPAEPTPEKPKNQGLDSRRFSSPQQRSASPFKSFFIRMGSTGMLNSTKSNRRSLQSVDDSEPISGKMATAHGMSLRSSRSPEKDQAPLFRSCSTSQLNTTPTYVKGDDPSEGIDLRMSGKDNNKTVSCDNLAGQLIDDVFEPAEIPSTPMSTFNPCDFGDAHRGELNLVRKSVSCEFREPRESRDPKEMMKKTNFPYAFLRSKLSVLPEEKHGTSAGVGAPFTSSVSKQPPEERLFKTVSEEHFPSLLRVDDGTETTTLGRRRSRQTGSSAYFKAGGRNSYSEYRSPSYEQERHILGSISSVVGQDRVDFGMTATTDYPDLEAAAAPSTTTATLRSQRRNSAPSAEQRLSSHYVSSNESGYDSDGPRGESAAASEAEALSLNRADSSDTSSVVDSEIEKPTRSSTPSEYTEQPEGMHVHVHHHHHHHHQGHQGLQNPREEVTVENGMEGLRWHQTTSGRILPSINQISGTESDTGDQEIRENVVAASNIASPHRVRLQQDKTRFLSDIIQPAERVRRCRLVNLTKTDPSESLGIRLAQQMSERHVRYVVVELENKGIAHRDGRLRLGDEIVEVEGRDLSTLESLQAVQDFLASFRGKKVQLLTAYEENVPQVCARTLGLLPGETEYFENAKTLSNISLCDERRVIIQEKTNPCTIEERKRPDYLPLTSSNIAASESSSAEILLEAHRYLTKHVARFEKGYGKPSLGFSVVGGRDSPRGEMGIFVRRVFPGGQADVSKSLLQGDEITTLNGKILRGYTHREVIELFKAVREGPVELEIARRHRYPKSVAESATY